MNRSKAAFSVLALMLVTACASHDAQDRYVLGAANETNIAEHAERDVSVPNSKEVSGIDGTRAARAVNSMKDSASKRVAQAATSSGSEN